MRLLHVWPDHVSGRPPARTRGAGQRRDPRIDERQHLSVWRLQEYLRRDPVRPHPRLIPMRAFAFQRSTSIDEAIAQHGDDPACAFLAGGTTLIDLVKLDV